MNKRLLLLLIMLAPLSAHADALGLEVGAGKWNQDAEGDVDTDNTLNTTFTEGDDNHILWINLEHPIPLLPNIRLASAPLNASNGIGDSLELKQRDLTLYYEILDDGFNLDLGVTGRRVEGTIDTLLSDDSIDVTVPMAYIKAELESPVGLSVGTEINTINMYHDVAVFVAYETDFGLGIQAGKRKQTIDVDEDEVRSSLTNEGLYAAAYFDF